uniref:ISXO2-like transposase domain-containing protein n=1 Tax=Anoplophora glabripennis TaxID=217634 RepID=V5GTL7_ANOGL
MDPAVFMRGHFNSYSLGYYLGIDGTETAEQKRRSNEQGLKLLQLYGVIPIRNTPANCPDCNAPLSTISERERYGWRYSCRNHQARKKFSPLENTFLSRARLNGEMTADKIILIIDMWLKREPLLSAQETLSMSANTVVAWYGFCRDVACAIAWHDFIPIGGAGDVVEVDEFHLFKRKHNVGRETMSEHAWVVGGISRTTKNRFAVIVERRDADILMPLLQQCIDGNSYICTDGWKAYEDCDMVFNGHGVANHNQNFLNPPREEEPNWASAGTFNEECLDTKWNGPAPQPGYVPFRNHTQTIERAWRDLKECLKTTNSMEYASEYIGEWMYRKDILERNLNMKEKFEKFLRDIRRAYPGIGKKPMKKSFEDLLDCDCHECEP